MKKCVRISVLTGLILVLALNFIGCVASKTSYRKEKASLKDRIHQLEQENEKLCQSITILYKLNKTLHDQLAKQKGFSFDSSAQLDINPLITGFQQKGLEVTIRGGFPAIIVSDIFEPGKASLSKKGRESIKKTASIIISKLPACFLRVDGYTDNQPIKKAREKYKNNQELSAVRAENVANFLVTECGFNKSRVQSQGLGEINPIANNKTKKGRNKNRRIELVILIK